MKAAKAMKRAPDADIFDEYEDKRNDIIKDLVKVSKTLRAINIQDTDISGRPDSNISYV